MKKMISKFLCEILLSKSFCSAYLQTFKAHSGYMSDDFFATELKIFLVEYVSYVWMAVRNVSMNFSKAEIRSFKFEGSFKFVWGDKSSKECSFA